MSADDFIRSYIPMIDFLAEILGKNSEVVLNDVRNLDHSIMAIRNNDISHRKVGDPASSLALQTIKAGKRETRDFIANYMGVSDANVSVRSSTYFLRYEGEIVAMICINTNEECLTDLRRDLDRVFSFYKPPTTELSNLDGSDNQTGEFTSKYEHLASSEESLAEHVVADYERTSGVKREYMKADDRKYCVRKLYEQGFFQLKESVANTAEALEASEATVYRYLKTVRREYNKEDPREEASN